MSVHNRFRLQEQHVPQDKDANSLIFGWARGSWRWICARRENGGVQRGYGGNRDSIAIYKGFWRGGLALGHSRMSQLLRYFGKRERLERRGLLMFQRRPGEVWDQMAGAATPWDGSYGRVWLMHAFPILHFSFTRRFNEILDGLLGSCDLERLRVSRFTIF